MAIIIPSDTGDRLKVQLPQKLMMQEIRPAIVPLLCVAALGFMTNILILEIDTIDRPVRSAIVPNTYELTVEVLL